MTEEDRILYDSYDQIDNDNIIVIVNGVRTLVNNSLENGKIKSIEFLIKKFTEKEEYVKCHELKKRLDLLINKNER